MSEYNELTDEERLAQSLIGVTIDRYVHRELTPYGAEQIAERLIDMLPELEVPESIELSSKQSWAPSVAVPLELEKKLTVWSVTTVAGETHAQRMKRLLFMLTKEFEAQWDAGYERAEADADATGFWSKRLRANPHRGVK